jgi:hypothetical protein
MLSATKEKFTDDGFMTNLVMGSISIGYVMSLRNNSKMSASMVC